MSNFKKELVAVQHSRPKFDNITKVEWIIGDVCNFTCTYCYDKEKGNFRSTEDHFRAIDLLAKKFENRKFILLLGGGEPSIRPDIKEICSYMAQRGINPQMITNGSKSPELYTSMMPDIVGYTFSVHFEQKGVSKTIDSIFAVNDRVKELKKIHEKYYLHVHVMMTPGYFKEAKELIARFDKHNISYVLRRIRPNRDNDNNIIWPKGSGKSQNAEAQKPLSGDYYSQEELDYLYNRLFEKFNNTEEIWRNSKGNIETKLSNSDDLGTRQLNRFKNWKCWIGFERLEISHDGSVYRSYCKVGGKLGNIFEDFKLPTKPVTCTWNACDCSWAMSVSKAKDSDAEKKLRINAYLKKLP